MYVTKQSSQYRLLKIIMMFSLSISFFYIASAFAETQNLGQVAKNVTGTFKSVTKLVTAGAYVAGLGFAVGAILKFKAHKDNPTQIPIGTPIALLFVAVALIFLPTVLGVTGQTLFSTSGVTGGPSGEIFTSTSAGGTGA